MKILVLQQPGSATSTLLLLGIPAGSSGSVGHGVLGLVQNLLEEPGGKESVCVSPSVSGAGTTGEVMEVRRCL